MPKKPFDPNNEDHWNSPEGRKREEYSRKFPAFNGDLVVDLKLELLGEKIVRKVKFRYTHTPEWEYFDLRKHKPFVGWAMSSFGMSIEAVPEVQLRDGSMKPRKSKWTDAANLVAEGVLSHAMWEAIDNALDDHCKAEDQKRRRRNTKPRRMCVS